MADDDGMIVRPWGSKKLARLRNEWTALESVAWIASGDIDLVSGIAGYIANCTWPEEMRDGMAATALASDIEVMFCRCGLPHLYPRVARAFEALTHEQRAEAESNTDSMVMAQVYEAKQRRCVCFAEAERKLFTAAEAGDLKLSGSINGRRGKVPRSAWRGATLRSSQGLRLGCEGWSDILFLRRDIERLEPATSKKPKAVSDMPRLGRDALDAWMRTNPPVGQREAQRDAAAAFPGYKVRQEDVRQSYREITGRTTPGPRGNKAQ